MLLKSCLAAVLQFLVVVYFLMSFVINLFSFLCMISLFSFSLPFSLVALSIHISFSAFTLVFRLKEHYQSFHCYLISLHCIEAHKVVRSWLNSVWFKMTMRTLWIPILKETLEVLTLFGARLAKFCPCYHISLINPRWKLQMISYFITLLFWTFHKSHWVHFSKNFWKIWKFKEKHIFIIITKGSPLWKKIKKILKMIFFPKNHSFSTSIWFLNDLSAFLGKFVSQIMAENSA